MSAQAGARASLSINGAAIAERNEPLLAEVIVDSDSDAPDSCLLVFTDPRRDLLKDLGVGLADPITVDMAPTGSTTAERLFAGKIYGIEFEFDEHGAFVHLTAYDNSYGLRLGRQTRNFNDVSDSDVVKKIAQEAKLRVGKVESTPVKHKHLAQLNETNWEFLKRRANALDFDVFVVGEELHFVKSAKSSAGPNPGGHDHGDRLQLVPGGNVDHLRVRVTAAQQVGEIQVRGWDPSSKKAVVSKKQAATRSVDRETSPADVANKVGNPKGLRCAPSFTTQAECDALADSEVERYGASFNFAEGTAKGDPKLRAGTAVSLGQTGSFDGKYVISSARHAIDANGYRTHFRVTGPLDRSLLGLTSPTKRPALLDHGLVPAVVTNIKDPDKRGRVKVKLPWLSDDYESDWARVSHVGAGNKRGLMWFPEVDDEVLVGFLGNDAAAPVVLGGFYNGKDKEPFDKAINASDGRVEIRGLRTRAGHALQFDDTKGKERIELVTADEKTKIVLDQNGKKLTIETDNDVVVSAKGKMSLSSDGDLSMTSKGKATISADGGLTLKSSGNVEVSGSQIKLN